jgi:subtilisin family serine protease
MTTNGGYDERCGTSFSAPAVAGVAALLWSRSPTLTAAQVRQRLKSTAIAYSPAAQYGSGRVDAYNAVYVPPPAYSATITGPSAVRPSATCGFSASTTSPYGPYTYKWTVNGGKPWYTTSTINHKAGSSSFTLDVTITDAQGGKSYASSFVTVSSSAPICYDQ